MAGGGEAPASAGVDVDALLGYARSKLGIPYVWGGTTDKGYDCSGFAQAVFGHFGISLPRTSEQQANVGAPVAKNQIQAGDLVFSDWGDGANSHVGIATSSGQIIDAPHTGSVVRYDTLDSNYLNHVTAVRRMSGLFGASGVTKGVADGSGGGSGSSGGLFAPIMQPLDDIANAAMSVGKFADIATKAFMPTNAVRILSGITGAIFVLLGIFFLSREVRGS